MKRISLKNQLHGDPNPNRESITTASAENDQVILNIVGGAISFVAPGSVPDDEVTQDKYLERYVNCTLQLENGAQLLLWINAGACGVEVQVEAAPREKKHGKRRGLEPARVTWR